MKTLLLLHSCLCETPQETTHVNSTLRRIEPVIVQLLSCFLSNELKYLPPHPPPPCKEKKNQVCEIKSIKKIKPEKKACKQNKYSAFY